MQKLGTLPSQLATNTPVACSMRNAFLRRRRLLLLLLLGLLAVLLWLRDPSRRLLFRAPSQLRLVPSSIEAEVPASLTVEGGTPGTELLLVPTACADCGESVRVTVPADGASMVSVRLAAGLYIVSHGGRPTGQPTGLPAG